MLERIKAALQALFAEHGVTSANIDNDTLAERAAHAAIEASAEPAETTEAAGDETAAEQPAPDPATS